MIRIWIKENVTKCMLFMWIIFMYFSLERGYITALAFNWFNECDVREGDGWNLAWSKLLYINWIFGEVGVNERTWWGFTPVLVLKKRGIGKYPTSFITPHFSCTPCRLSLSWLDQRTEGIIDSLGAWNTWKSDATPTSSSDRLQRDRAWNWKQHEFSFETLASIGE